MVKPVWPKYEGGPSLEEYARRCLTLSLSHEEASFDLPLDDQERGAPDGSYFELEADWAVCAARAIIDELNDRGAAMEEAFHPEKIDQETRVDIVEVMAAIMRESLRLAKNK